MKTRTFKVAVLLIVTALLSFNNYMYASWTAGHTVVNGVKYKIYFSNIQDDYTHLGALVEGYTSDCPSNLTIPTDILYSIQKGSEIITYTVPVSRVGEKAFFECSILKSVSIPKIGLEDSAFEGCVNLESVDWKEVPVTHVYSSEGDYDTYLMREKRVFAGCTSLKDVSLPPLLEVLEESTFEGCTSLEGITLPSGLKELRSSVFKGCTALKSIHLPSDLKRIPGYAFQNCTSLEEITLPTSLAYIGVCAFNNCSSLKNIYSDILDAGQIDYYGGDDKELLFKEFEGIHPHSVLHIPKGARQSYAQQGVWNGIRFIRENGAKMVSNIGELSNSKAYRIQAEQARRGILYPGNIDDINLLVTSGGGGDYYTDWVSKIDDTDKNQQFAIYNKEGKYYLYNVGTKQFVSGYGHRFFDVDVWQEQHYWNDPNVIHFIMSKTPGFDVSITSSSEAGEFIFALDDKEWINLSVSGCVGGWTTEDGGNRLEIVEVGDLSEDVQAEIEKAFDHVVFQVGDLSQLSNEKCYLLKTHKVSYYDEPGVVYANKEGFLDIIDGSSDYPNSGFDAVDMNDSNNQYALYNYGGFFYFYNVGQSKFVDLDNLGETPIEHYILPDDYTGTFFLCTVYEDYIDESMGCFEIYEAGVLSAEVQNDIIAALGGDTGIQPLENDRCKIQISDLHGRCITKMQHGVNIIRYSDGSNRKVLVK